MAFPAKHPLCGLQHIPHVPPRGPLLPRPNCYVTHNPSPTLPLPTKRFTLMHPRTQPYTLTYRLVTTSQRATSAVIHYRVPRSIPGLASGRGHAVFCGVP